MSAVVVRYRFAADLAGVNVSPEGRMAFFDDGAEFIIDVVGPFSTLFDAGLWIQANEENDCNYSTHELVES